jgi:hypothetical protein
MDAINGELFKQAYKSSIDASEHLNRYQMYKLLEGPYDKEGACIIVTAVSEGVATRKIIYKNNVVLTTTHRYKRY